MKKLAISTVLLSLAGFTMFSFANTVMLKNSFPVGTTLNVVVHQEKCSMQPGFQPKVCQILSSKNLQIKGGDQGIPVTLKAASDGYANKLVVDKVSSTNGKYAASNVCSTQFFDAAQKNVKQVLTFSPINGVSSPNVECTTGRYEK